MSLPYVDDVALQENIVKTKEHVESVRSALDTAKQNKMEFSTMPNAVASLEGLAVIYTGQTNVTYTQGSIYLCQEVTPETDPKTYEWVELTVPIEMDSALDNTSTNGIQNQAVTNALQALQNGVALIYSSESALPSIVNYAGGVIVAVGTVGYCVLERTWHKVTAINSSSLAITWSAFDPNIAVEDVNLLPSISSDLVVAQKTYILKGTQTGYQTGGIYEAKANTVTPEGTENPSEEGWYELSSGSYILSEDTEVASGKTYYALEWVLISANPLTFDSDDFNVANNEVSLQPARRVWNGHKEDWEGLTQAQRQAYAGGLANFDDDDGNQIQWFADQLELSDFESITIPTSSDAAISMEYDGYLFALTNGNGTASYNTETSVYVNGIRIYTSFYASSTTNGAINYPIPVKKGDSVYKLGDGTSYARFYKKRDYSMRA